MSAMTVHFLNAFTCNARVPAHWRTGALCLLVETRDGLVLVDTGIGREDYLRRPAILNAFRVLTHVPLDPEQAAIRQVARLGYAPTDVRHIVLTHMHFDHCGGLPDFPDASVHVHRRELRAFYGRRSRWTDVGYVRRHVAHGPRFVPHEEAGDAWLGLPAVHLPFEPEMWLVPTFGHTRGHCAVAVAVEDGWLLHVGDAATLNLDPVAPEWFTRLVLGPHQPALREFRTAHPDVRVVTGHMWLDFFPGSDAGLRRDERP
jgi:glyoxylase-like metal-dependent hydrolase (beta-lactamase superfamily II)